jgi:hypothetical protein
MSEYVERVILEAETWETLRELLLHPDSACERHSRSGGLAFES